MWQFCRELAKVYSQMPKEVQQRVHNRFISSGALPVSRDTPSYIAVLSVLLGGAAGQLDYLNGAKVLSPYLPCQCLCHEYPPTLNVCHISYSPVPTPKDADAEEGSGGEAKSAMSSTGMLEYDMWDSRAEAKKVICYPIFTPQMSCVSPRIFARSIGTSRAFGNGKATRFQLGRRKAHRWRAAR